MKLTRNQDLFVHEYLKDRNGTRAYLAAYPNVKKEKTAGCAAVRLLGNVRIQAAIDDAIERQKERLGIDADSVLMETARVAFSDTGKLFDENGNLKPIKDLPAEVRAFVQSIKTSRSIVAGSVVEVTKIKLWNKMDALGKLSKHFGLFNDRTEHLISPETLNLILSALPETVARALKAKLAYMAKGAISR